MTKPLKNNQEIRRAIVMIQQAGDDVDLGKIATVLGLEFGLPVDRAYRLVLIASRIHTFRGLRRQEALQNESPRDTLVCNESRNEPTEPINLKAVDIVTGEVGEPTDIQTDAGTIRACWLGTVSNGKELADAMRLMQAISIERAVDGLCRKQPNEDRAPTGWGSR